MDWKERNTIHKQIMGYDWYDIVDKYNVYYIGSGWQAGIGQGTVNDNTIYYLYYGSPNRNETFFTIVKISKNDYQKIKDEYKEYLVNPKTKEFKKIPNEKLDQLYQTYIKADHGNIIMEGWELV